MARWLGGSGDALERGGVLGDRLRWHEAPELASNASRWSIATTSAHQWGAGDRGRIAHQAR